MTVAVYNLILPIHLVFGEATWFNRYLCVRDWSGILCEARTMDFGFFERGENQSEQRYSGTPQKKVNRPWVYIVLTQGPKLCVPLRLCERRPQFLSHLRSYDL